jgi:hypothetical protein
VELAAAKISVADLRAATRQHRAGLALRADSAFGAWLAQISPLGLRFQPKVKA